MKKYQFIQKQLINFKVLSFFILLFLSTTISAQITFPFTSSQQRLALENKLINDINNIEKLKVTDSNYSKFKSAYWAMELIQYKPKWFHHFALKNITQLPSTSAQYQQAFLEMLYTLYPKMYTTEIEKIWQQLATAKNKVTALEYLALAKKYPVIKDFTTDSLYFYLYKKHINTAKKNFDPNAILNTHFLPNQIVVVSFQYHDRNKPGFLMIRTSQHQWLKNKDSSVFKAPQLARSVTNLPYYITNGNTPQGLYKLDGFDSSTNNFIGPTTNLQMRMPFEIDDDSFFVNNQRNTELSYKTLLGSLSSYDNLWQSFYAGKIGRSEIIAHGTAINPNYYKNKPYYPNTPSMGCLCSPEIWNDKGIRTYSAQQLWIDELKKLGGGKGYLIVVEID